MGRLGLVPAQHGDGTEDEYFSEVHGGGSEEAVEVNVRSDNSRAVLAVAVDAIAPVIGGIDSVSTVNMPDAGTFVEVAVTANDNIKISKVKCWDSVNVNSVDPIRNVSLSQSPDGKWRGNVWVERRGVGQGLLVAEVTDRAGNRSTAFKKQLELLDISPPKLWIIQPKANAKCSWAGASTELEVVVDVQDLSII